MKSKNKKLISLRKRVNQQKLKYGITENFSYRFDYRTKKLILTYYVPTIVNKNGKVKNKKIPKSKYRPNINENNYLRYFKGDTTIVRDDAVFVRKQIEKYESKNSVGDEYDFKWWVVSYLNRSVGKTKTIKVLSPLTLKQNKFHINEYKDWCEKYDSKSLDMFSHIDFGTEWFEKYYEEKLKSGRWSATTIGISYRNVRGFYNYVADRHKEKFPHDILKRLKIPQAQHQRDTIRTDEYELIRDFIIENEKDEYWGKFILMLRLQLKTGMRVGELVSIRNRNIDKKTKQIQIVGKGDRTRKLNFRHKTDKHIWESILSKMTDGIFLFYRTRVQYFPTLDKKIEIEIDKNKPTTTSYYSQRFREMRDEELKLRGKGVITSHSLRRYFITRFVKETGRRDLVRQIVGHTSTRMTDYYMGDLIETDTLTTIDIGV